MKVGYGLFHTDGDTGAFNTGFLMEIFFPPGDMTMSEHTPSISISISPNVIFMLSYLVPICRSERSWLASSSASSSRTKHVSKVTVLLSAGGISATSLFPKLQLLPTWSRGDKGGSYRSDHERLSYRRAEGRISLNGLIITTRLPFTKVLAS
jgi:hypothetical protein